MDITYKSHGIVYFSPRPIYRPFVSRGQKFNFTKWQKEGNKRCVFTGPYNLRNVKLNLKSVRLCYLKVGPLANKIRYLKLGPMATVGMVKLDRSGAKDGPLRKVGP